MVIGVVLIAVIVAAGFFYNQQNASVASVQEIESMLNTNITGNIRAEETGTMTKKELVSSIIAETVDVQKSHLNKLKIDFVFLDNKGKRTDLEKSIESVQIQTSLLNDKGEAHTKSVKRISLKQQ